MVGSSEWIKERFHVEGEIPIRKENEVCKELFCCAYREYDENSGATGGPGGVLHMQKTLMGNCIKGIKLQYIFKPSERCIPEKIWEEMSQLNGKVKMILAAAGYIYSNECIRQSMVQGKKPMLFCHDVGSAYGAYLLGVPYELVYHQQGSVLQEIVSAGGQYSDNDVEVIRFIELEIMSNASKIYFPSIGARKVFEETTILKQEEFYKLPIADVPLYNTIGEITERINVEKLYDKYHVELEGDEELFVSIGDYNLDKGLDQIPSYLKSYKEKTNKKVVWIAVGNRTENELYERTKQKCAELGIQSYLIDKRISHIEAIALLENADYYIMLHRKSIFDLATLEAMRAGCKLILSDCKSNAEYNVNDNVVLVQKDRIDFAIQEMSMKNTKKWEHSNRIAFKNHFSNSCFLKQYVGALGEFLADMGGMVNRYVSEVNQRQLAEWKDKYKGKKCIICGSGASLDDLEVQEKETVYIALNRALFYSKIKFDFLFMQDEPKSQSYTLEDYNKYDCVKFYGIITNKDLPVEGLGKEDRLYQSVKNRIIRYELSPTIFDYRVDDFEKETDNYCLSDAQSVLFSAIQVAILMGFTDIWLCGVEFSDTNYGNKSNPSKYAINVSKNLLAYKEQLESDKKVKLSFLYTSNDFLKEAFEGIERKDKEVIVSGIYTKDYKAQVRLQEKSCLDDYKFDFRFVSDDEWQKNRTGHEFAFFGGNIIKVQLVIDKIREYWGKVLIIADADLIFLDKTKTQLLSELESVDMLFLRERNNSEKLYERAVENINIGFVVMKCNEASLNFWLKVREETVKERGWDQEIVNILIHENKESIKYKLLPDCYLNGGSINKESIVKQKICTSCGTIAKRQGLTKIDFLLEAFNRYKKKEWF